MKFKKLCLTVSLFLFLNVTNVMANIDFSLVGYGTTTGSTDERNRSNNSVHQTVTGGQGSNPQVVSYGEDIESAMESGDYDDGMILYIDDPQHLQSALLGIMRYHRSGSNAPPHPPVTFYITGELTPHGVSEFRIEDSENISIIGDGDKGVLNGIGIRVIRSSNVIIRNLNIFNVRAGEATGLEIAYSNNLWIDRNHFHSEPITYNPDGSVNDDDEFKEKYDELLSIKHSSNAITVSWNIFEHHYKGILVGHSDSPSAAPDNITFHHNMFYEINTRVPLNRYATTHMFNNVFEDIPGSAINSREGAQVRIERNVFRNVGSGNVDNQGGYIQGPVGWWYGSGTGYWHLIDNIIEDSPVDDKVWENELSSTDVPYSYEHILDRVEDVEGIVREHAGRSFEAATDDPLEYYSLTLSTTGNGSVRAEPQRTSFAEGTIVTITANPEPGWALTNWSGDVGGSGNSITVAMDGDKSITANFSESDVPVFELTVNVNGDGTVNPSSGIFEQGDEVELSALPRSGWVFESWSGDIEGTSGFTTITMDSDKTVTANFIEGSSGDVKPVGSFVTEPLTSADFNERAFYMFINRSNGKAIDIQNRSIENDASIITAEIEDAIPQLWRVEFEENNFNIINAHTDKVMRDAGSDVRQERDGSSGTHYWDIQHVEDSYFKLTNEGRGSVLTASGENVIGADDNNSSEQQWQILRVTASSVEPDFSIQGFATVGEGTTGGEGGEVVTVSTAEDLIYYMQHEDPYIILIDGEIVLGEGDAHRPQHNMHSIAPNKTLFGLEGAKIRGGGLNIRGTRNDGVGEVTRTNIIIRNIRFTGGAPDDYINIEHGATHVWIDHNTFEGPADDGIIDIKREASYITISWNVIHDHHKTMLLGHDESHTHDRGFLKVTYHHNYIYNSESRHPRMRFGEAHLFNNYFEDIGSYVMGPGIEAQIISENNHVWNSGRFTDWYHETGIVLERGQGSLINRINHDHDPRIKTGEPDWAPEDYYSYTLNSALSVRDMVTRYAGAGIVSYDDETTSVQNIHSRNLSGKNGVFAITGTNHFSPVTEIRYNLDEPAQVNIQLLNARGQNLSTFSRYLPTGTHTHSISMSNFSSGVYFLRMKAGNEVTVQRLIR
ncbi:RICIN domain-containing protein [Chitinispirillales bacterium ANBcel5]|uniref:pectate lyase family protein n=1 Tax=Cellulosispirillum alkaliphilum TaxID=3039283 RepID=UPI002A58356E|nr:RICIN domain-containing protein [Chitinispirillales bacterium ANBcel5]